MIFLFGIKIIKIHKHCIYFYWFEMPKNNSSKIKPKQVFILNFQTDMDEQIKEITTKQLFCLLFAI